MEDIKRRKDWNKGISKKNEIGTMIKSKTSGITLIALVVTIVLNLNKFKKLISNKNYL